MAEHRERNTRNLTRRLTTLCVLAVILTGVIWSPASLGAVQSAEAAGCRIYVGAGDDIPAGHDLNDDDKRYPDQLLKDHLISPGWCLYNQGANELTSSKFISDGGKN
jgi:hypothetical protein